MEADSGETMAHINHDSSTVRVLMNEKHVDVDHLKVFVLRPPRDKTCLRLRLRLPMLIDLQPPDVEYYVY